MHWTVKKKLFGKSGGFERNCSCHILVPAPQVFPWAVSDWGRHRSTGEMSDCVLTSGQVLVLTGPSLAVLGLGHTIWISRPALGGGEAAFN